MQKGEQPERMELRIGCMPLALLVGLALLPVLLVGAVEGVSLALGGTLDAARRRRLALRRSLPEGR